MRYALVSDIHANLQAWMAVEGDLQRMKPDEVICLGDIIGYGPNPVEVLERVYKRCDHFVMGNHDAAVCGQFNVEDFNEEARAVIGWTRNQLNDYAVSTLNETPYLLLAERFGCSHAEFELPERFDYIFEPEEARPSFACTDAPILFVGHTHVPCTIRLSPDGTLSHLKPRTFDLQPGYRYLVNVGSVGDPRDGLTRSSYVLFDDQTGRVEFRSIPFDLAGYRRALAASGLPTQPYLFDVQEKRQREQIAARVRSFRRREDNAIPGVSTKQAARLQRPVPRGVKVIAKNRESFARSTGSQVRQAATPRRGLWIGMILVPALAAAGLLFGLSRKEGKEKSGQAVTEAAETITQQNLPPIQPEELNNLVAQVRKGEITYEDAISQLNRMKGRGGVSAQGLLIRTRTNLEKARDEGKYQILLELGSEAAKLAEKKKYIEAMDILKNYSGAFAEETLSERVKRAGEYEGPAENQRREAHARLGNQLDKARADVVRHLAELRMDDAEKIVEKLGKTPEMSSLTEFADLTRELGIFLAMQDAVCQSFAESKGRYLDLTIDKVSRRVEVLDAADRKFTIQIEGEKRPRVLMVRNLSAQDLIGRLGLATAESKAAWTGLLWGKNGNIQEADRSFQGCRELVLARELLEYFRNNSRK